MSHASCAVARYRECKAAAKNLLLLSILPGRRLRIGEGFAPIIHYFAASYHLLITRITILDLGELFFSVLQTAAVQRHFAPSS